MTSAATLLQSEPSTSSIEQLLAAEREKELLRFSTAGSVDDGKSTLIGRLLYDSQNVYEDQVRAVTHTHAGHTRPSIDFAQLTDGLRAEREQGITIDVAYRYFSTQRRKFIVADTPGHEQYTRNMATGASTADLAIILVDARKGVLTQSRRHAYIASLLGIRHIVAAINKMDLVNFSEEVFRSIDSQIRTVAGKLGRLTLQVIPISALEGDNVVTPSERTPWYDGPTLLEHLETVPLREHDGSEPLRFPVQRVLRPDQHYRGFAGQIARGSVRPGDAILALPSGRTSRIASITTFDGDLENATAPLSVALTLEDELDISRGDVIAALEAPPQQASLLEASLVWFDSERLESEQPYLLKHGTQTMRARITRVLSRTNVDALEPEAVGSLSMNDIGLVEIATARPLFFDPYEESRATGSFILINERSNATAAAGMIRRGLGAEQKAEKSLHRPALIIPENAAVTDALERLLLLQNCAVVRTKVQSESTWQRLLDAGVIALVESDGGHTRLGRLGIISRSRSGAIEWLVRENSTAGSPAQAASAWLEALHLNEIVRTSEGGHA